MIRSWWYEMYALIRGHVLGHVTDDELEERSGQLLRYVRTE